VNVETRIIPLAIKLLLYCEIPNWTGIKHSKIGKKFNVNKIEELLSF
jgi:hypothetical protein